MEILHSKFKTRGIEKVLRTVKRQPSKMLGEGATSRVYPFGRNKVIRIQDTNGDYCASTGLTWAKFCIKSRSKHVPKIDFLGVERDEDGEILRVVTILERLHEVDEIEDYEEHAYKAHDVEDYLMGSMSRYREENMAETWKLLGKHFPRKAAYSLRKTLKKDRVYFNDMHAGNWMLRKSDKRFVITDPIC